MKTSRWISILVLLITACVYAYGDETQSAASVPNAPETVTTETRESSGESVKTETVDKESAPKAMAMSSALTGGDEVSEGGLGKGVAMSPLLSESFQTDLATGSSTVSVPFVVPPGRKNMQPSLGLSYSSNNSNGVCGVGWGLTTSSIQRSTKKGPPVYDDTDTFVFGSSGSSGDLILINSSTNEYRQKIETAYMKYIFDKTNSKWTVYDKNGAKYTFGSTSDARLSDSNGTMVFAWYLDSVMDVYGNAVKFTYIKDEGQVYLAKVDYTSNDNVTPALSADKSVELVYTDNRTDVLFNYRSGWKIATKKTLKEVVVKVDGAMVWKYVFDYTKSTDTARTLLDSVTLFDAEGKSLPKKKFTYQKTS